MEYDRALFFPGVPVLVSDFINPYAPSSVIIGGGASPGKDPQCPRGSVFVNGKCYGAVLPGKKCRTDDGKTVPCSSLKK